MHSKTSRSALMVLLTVGVLIPTYATGGVNSGDINLVSVRQEWELGRKLSADLARKLDLVENRAAVAYLNRMGRRMSSRTELGRLRWRFHLVRDATINAYNIPGGHVYVHTGLVRAAGSAAELAGALSHEIGHGAARHGTEQLTRNYGLSLVVGLLLGEDPATYQQILTQVVAGGAMANYGRDAEREADRLGDREPHPRRPRGDLPATTQARPHPERARVRCLQARRALTREREALGRVAGTFGRPASRSPAGRGRLDRS